MRKKVHRLCVENLRDSRWNVDSAGELRQPFRLGLGGVVGGKAATANIESPRRRLPARAHPANTHGAGESRCWRSRASLRQAGNP
jgi:hypothetical protein